jgi:hypothetical protein
MNTIRYSKPLLLKLLFLPLAMVLGMLVSKGGVITIAMLILLTLAFFYLLYLYQSPKRGVYTALLFSFFVNGVTRYIDAGPLGLSVDIVLVVTLLVALFSPLKPNSQFLKSGVFIFSIVWLLYTIMEIANPEARSKEAWFYAVRGVSLYQVFTLAIALMYMQSVADIRKFIHINLIIIVIAVFWGARQLFIGTDAAETAWLAAGAYKTHVIRGVLRVFSFFSDAGQFGATAAYAGVVGGIMALGPFKTSTRIWYGIAGVLGIWGMMLSGTRGALFVVATGVFAYLIATRNIKAIIIGSLLSAGAYGFLKYTTIANDNNQVRRLRSALDPNDPSLQVRLENQKKFKEYLATRPIGGGIGTSGSWGIRFTPGTFLAETANDSWYVKIWAETGVVGLTLHIAMLVFFIGYGYIVIFRIRDPVLRTYIMAIHAGYVGIAFAAYGNPILGQFPLSIMLYTTWAFFVLAPHFDKKIQQQKLVT